MVVLGGEAPSVQVVAVGVFAVRGLFVAVVVGLFPMEGMATAVTKPVAAVAVVSVVRVVAAVFAAPTKPVVHVALTVTAVAGCKAFAHDVQLRAAGAPGGIGAAEGVDERG